MAKMKFVLIENGDDDDDAIFINPKEVTHWHKSEAGAGTKIYFKSGASLTVQYGVWDVACLVDPGPPEPAITSTVSKLVAGSWEAGEAVTIETVHTRADGSTSTHIHKTTFTGEIEHSDYTGKDYYVCVGGSFDGHERADSRFSFDVTRFSDN